MGIAARCLHGVGVCFIPRPDNDDRPLALRHRPLALISVFLVLVKVVAIGFLALIPQSAELSTITAARVVQLTNSERRGAGLPDLVVSDALSRAAAQKAQHILDKDYFAHISPDGVTPWFWMAKVGYHYRVAGENLAIDFTDVEDVVHAWMASPTHRDNILHPRYVETGVAVLTGEFQGGTSTVVVHMFGLPAEGYVAAQSSITEPTPSPVPSPSATPLPTTAPPPASSPSPQQPPAVPRIAVRDTASAFRDAVVLSVSGKPHTTTYVLANKKPRGAFTLNARGAGEYSVSLSDLPDGTVILQAYSRDAYGGQSDLSEAVAIIKDATGPALAREQISFILSPATDHPSVLLMLAESDYTVVDIAHNGRVIASSTDTSLPFTIPTPDAPLNISVRDAAGNISEVSQVKLAPQFFTERFPDRVPSSARLSQFARFITAAAFAALLILLVLAILVRIRIQHPALITHVSLVLILAGALFIL